MAAVAAMHLDAEVVLTPPLLRGPGASIFSTPAEQEEVFFVLMVAAGMPRDAALILRTTHCACYGLPHRVPASLLQLEIGTMSVDRIDAISESLKRARAIVRLAEDIDTGSSGGVESIAVAMQIAGEEIERAQRALAQDKI
ncbi:MAG: hypothetical protein GEV05_27205 [Betaproteobacteria bacterium]|nr:hypothetical protein [Betaproteobacteria bacterium]